MVGDDGWRSRGALPVVLKPYFGQEVTPSGKKMRKAGTERECYSHDGEISDKHRDFSVLSAQKVTDGDDGF